MLTTITIIVSFFVALNFFLLKFSSNKTAQRKNTERPLVIIKKEPTDITTRQLLDPLAPTGS